MRWPRSNSSARCLSDRAAVGHGLSSLEAVSKLLRLPFRASAMLEILTYFYVRCGFSAQASRELTALAEF